MKKLFLILFIFMFADVFSSVENVISSGTPTVQPGTFSLVAKHRSELIKWYQGNQKNVLVVATENKVHEATPELNVNYSASSEFGKGSRVGEGFVVYKGDGNSISVKGLKPNRKYYFTIYECNASGLYLSDDSFLLSEDTEAAKAGPNVSPSAVVVCVCPPIAGVTCSITGTTNTGTSTASAAGCPHVGYCNGAGTSNPWTNSTGVGNIQWLFSAPVNLSTLRMNSVNTNDYGTISAAGGSGGTISLSGVICMGVSGLVVGPLTTAGYGGVYFTVNSTGSYTSVTLSNTAQQSGFVAACPTAINSVLPIELVSLKGECKGKKIGLEWKTLTEKNNSYFTIERSYDTESWEVIGQIPGAGNSTSLKKYNFDDETPLQLTTYYRLKQTDFNKEFKYSELIFVESCNGNNEIAIYPNPAKHEVFVKVKEDAVLEIYNVFGEKVSEHELKAGENKIDLHVFNGGTYLFKVSNSAATKFSKVVVNN